MTVKATIVEVDAKRLKPLGAPTPVDFNPQSLRLTHSSTGPQATQGTSGSKAEATTGGRQLTNYTTSLSIELLFDTTRDGKDVRDKTLPLVAMTRPKEKGASAGRLLRFQWGTFLFTGYIESLGETIDLFSTDGVPLRATLAVGLRGVAERDARPDSAGASGLGASAGAGLSAGASFGASAGVSAGASFGASAGVSAGASFGASASAAVGTTPLTISASGDTVQSLAARAGVSWKAVAAANGIDNPRLLPPGTVLDLRINA